MTRMGEQNIKKERLWTPALVSVMFSGARYCQREIRKTEKSVTRPWPLSLAVSNYSILLSSLASEYD